jgi:glucose-6-phosphate isomerase
MKNLIEQPAWLALSQHHHDLSAHHMRDLFAAEPGRFDQFSIKHNDILLDYSRNRINKTSMDLLVDLALAADLQSHIAALFAGELVNTTERRPALHTALRDQFPVSTPVYSADISTEIAESRAQLFRFTEEILAGKRLGMTGKAFKSVVNIGIGGSYLGPMMATSALKDFAVSSLSFHFISTIDPDHLSDVLALIDPETTLFIISSKSFTTLETMTNARTIMSWLTDKLGREALAKHVIAVTAHKHNALTFGVNSENIFTFWEWVGGRYSIWSAIGLPLLLMIGTQQFSEFLSGAHDIDQHFQHAPFKQNIPVILALLSIWYTNFFNASAHAIVPYSHRLRYFVPYIQQLEMESCGKSTDLNGDRVDYTTGAIVFGEEGCNGQHSYHQLLHQGQHLIPVDFILTAAPSSPEGQHHHELLLASALSQAYALMHGRTAAQLSKATDTTNLGQHLAIDGNKPSNILLLSHLTPRSLGALLAVYEHKIFVQGVIWNINPFDQWGVELGKQTLPEILHELQHPDHHSKLDASTISLIDHLNKLKGQS